jgi:hypothetical protein
MRSAWPGLLIVAVAASSGCRDLAEFEDEFELTAIGAEVVDAGEESFIRRGIAAKTRLFVDFDPDQLTLPDGPMSPGTLTTMDGTCGMGPTFDGTALMPIEPLAHDQLSLYEFPGVGRIRNHIFTARPASGPFAGRDVMVFVSLLRGARMEVRVMAGSVPAACEPREDPTMTPVEVCDRFRAGDCDLFALFRRVETSS